MTYKFKDWNVKVEKARYRNKRIALRLIDVDYGLPVATATINLPEQPCEPDEAYIKNWSENDGVLDFLLVNGIVELTGKSYDMTYTSAELVKIKI